MSVRTTALWNFSFPYTATKGRGSMSYPLGNSEYMLMICVVLCESFPPLSLSLSLFLVKKISLRRSRSNSFLKPILRTLFLPCTPTLQSFNIYIYIYNEKNQISLSLSLSLSLLSFLLHHRQTK